MRECICVQCSEDNARITYIQCVDCQLYGTNSEFEEDQDKEVCNDCMYTRREQDDIDKQAAHQDQLFEDHRDGLIEAKLRAKGENK